MSSGPIRVEFSLQQIRRYHSGMILLLPSGGPGKTAQVHQSFLGEIFALAQRTGALDLSTGYTDVLPPESVTECLATQNVGAWSRYSPVDGLPELREKLAEILRDENGIDVAPDTEVTITTGSSAALASAIFATVSPGDEVLVFEPFYSQYLNLINLAGGLPVVVPLSGEKLRVDEAELNSKVTRDTRAIIVNSPNNPTTRVFSLNELKIIADVCAEHGLIAVADEVYEKIVYEKNVHHSIASIPGMSERTITCNSFSKTFGMAGYRVGYVAARKELSKRIRNIHYNFTLSPSSYGQAAALAALENYKEYTMYTKKEYEKRRNHVVDAFKRLDGVSFKIPEGTYYLYIDVHELAENGLEFTRRLLTEANIAVMPGNEFGVCAAANVRLCFARKMPNLAEGINRIIQALDSWQLIA